MAILVQKFGGSSLANGEKIRRAAGLSLSAVRQGFQVVVVVSAQGDLTDQLLTQAGELCRAPSPRELDQLLSAGSRCPRRCSPWHWKSLAHRQCRSPAGRRGF